MTKPKKLSLLFAENVKKHRHLAGLTQEELANLSGLHRTYIGGIESNSRNVSLLAVEKIAKALDLNPSELFQVKVRDGK